MAHDSVLAERLRDLLRAEEGIAERRMFGGVAFLWRGHMVCGVAGDELVLRLGETGAAAALRRKHVREMDFTGKPMRTMVFVAAEGIRTRAALRAWIERALDFARTLPPKRPAGRAAERARVRARGQAPHPSNPESLD